MQNLLFPYFDKVILISNPIMHFSPVGFSCIPSPQLKIGFPQ